MNRRHVDPNKAFLGVGWAFPLAFAADRSIPPEGGGRDVPQGGSRDIATAVYEDDVRQAVLIILGTDRRERLMRPDFGAGLGDFLFEPLTATTAERVRTRVREALTDWEPRIDVVEVRVDVRGNEGRLDVTVDYRVRATNTLHNLVYPFYLDEGATA